jgi:5-methylcytosine-specific restriction endonuclease McrA
MFAKPLRPPTLSAEVLRRIDVWIKGSVIPGYDPTVWRRDSMGFAIRYSDYGNCESEFGWHIDHIIPKDKYGSDDISNLQPLHWKNNLQKSNKLPWPLFLRPQQ